ncbi:MAG: 8-oxo-dGTP diphosphatase [Clostridia bacterium]|nr:8-oxo-dGTP diphosphatase [Clostridia bacterium]
MINTTLCYIEQDGNYLLLHRIKKKNDINKDKWIGIGGKFLENESPEECVIRETKEETGLTLLNPRYRGIVTFVCDQGEGEWMHLFTADLFSGQLQECDEGELCWVPKKAVYQLPIWQGDKIFLKLIENPLQPFFSLKLVYDQDRLCQAVLNGEELSLENC